MQEVTVYFSKFHLADQLTPCTINSLITEDFNYLLISKLESVDEGVVFDMHEKHL